ncbi:hypothetical protein [Xanthomonas sp. 3498]|uniref:hypothetical protein n=1 Tax=Xanthomonas sp. 3498 TaxID=2663863 RepID=UPI00161D601F|nr:hypothetical protein [Xanthomonas sp. 3498]MBB5875853.1 hypothetical protein [Xanthomonas sp. 3498]
MTAENRIITIRFGKPSEGIANAGAVDIHATPVSEHIAVHPTQDASVLKCDRWTATHVPTGLRICRAPTKEVAIAAAEAFGRLDIDWSSVTPEAAKDWPEDLRNQARSVQSLARQGELEKLKAAFA